jgi:hypothetical protein
VRDGGAGIGPGGRLWRWPAFGLAIERSLHHLVDAAALKGPEMGVGVPGAEDHHLARLD